MILIDKSKTTNKIIVTVSEKTTVDSPVYTLALFSPYTNKDFTLTLPANTSPHPSRYDLFEMNTTLFADIEPGFLWYTITEATDGMVETGLMKVVDEVLTPQQEVDELFITMEPNPTEDDFITYNGS